MKIITPFFLLAKVILMFENKQLVNLQTLINKFDKNKAIRLEKQTSHTSLIELWIEIKKYCHKLLEN